MALFLDFIPASLLSNTSEYLQECRSAVENAQAVYESAGNRELIIESFTFSLRTLNKIKLSFLNKQRKFTAETYEQKISFITSILDLYQSAHEIFIKNKRKIREFDDYGDFLRDVKLQEYWFCSFKLQDEFQARADEILGKYDLEINEWFENMRDFEWLALNIPYRLITG